MSQLTELTDCQIQLFCNGNVMGTLQGDPVPIPYTLSAFKAKRDPNSILKQSNIAIFGEKCHFWVESGGSQGWEQGGEVMGTIQSDPGPIPHRVGVGGEVMGTIQGDPGPIPYRPSAFNPRQTLIPDSIPF